jgi:hypothetical protein
MKRTILIGSMLLALATIISCAPVTAGDETSDKYVPDEAVASTSQELFHSGQAWDGGNVLICTGLGTADTLIARANSILANSWERAANVRIGIFKSDSCEGYQLAGLPQLKFIPNTIGFSGYGAGTGEDTLITSSDTVAPFNLFAYQVIHEFGHVLSFAHEQQRPDNWFWGVARCNQFASGEKQINDGTYETDWDPNSVMNYCAGQPIRLSTLDIVGVRNLYGRNPNAHGFMIVNDSNPSLALNAWGGAKEGTVLRLHNKCNVSNPDCTWSYQNGMLVSDKDPTLAINAWGGAKAGTILKLTSTCTPSNPDCTWTYSKGEWLSDTNTALAIGAVQAVDFGATMSLRSSCSASDSQCTWTLPNVMLQSWATPNMALNAYGGAAHGTNIKFHGDCTVDNPDCTFTWSKGMLRSDTNSSLGVNAWGGAASGTAVRLHSGCTAGNPDCTWTWHLGEVVSDRGNFVMWPSYPDTGGSVILQGACTPTDPRCLFSSLSAR